MMKTARRCSLVSPVYWIDFRSNCQTHFVRTSQFGIRNFCAKSADSTRIRGFPPFKAKLKLIESTADAKRWGERSRSECVVSLFLLSHIRQTLFAHIIYDSIRSLHLSHVPTPFHPIPIHYRDNFPVHPFESAGFWLTELSAWERERRTLRQPHTPCTLWLHIDALGLLFVLPIICARACVFLHSIEARTASPLSQLEHMNECVYLVSRR